MIQSYSAIFCSYSACFFIFSASDSTGAFIGSSSISLSFCICTCMALSNSAILTWILAFLAAFSAAAFLAAALSASAFSAAAFSATAFSMAAFSAAAFSLALITSSLPQVVHFLLIATMTPSFMTSSAFFGVLSPSEEDFFSLPHSSGAVVMNWLVIGGSFSTVDSEAPFSGFMGSGRGSPIISANFLVIPSRIIRVCLMSAFNSCLAMSELLLSSSSSAPPLACIPSVSSGSESKISIITAGEAMASSQV